MASQTTCKRLSWGTTGDSSSGGFDYDYNVALSLFNDHTCEYRFTKTKEGPNYPKEITLDVQKTGRYSTPNENKIEIVLAGGTKIHLVYQGITKTPPPYSKEEQTWNATYEGNLEDAPEKFYEH
mmetsp:Transcript_4188/g.5861  ORF Transcript_4188/g.5861 Transcript_4188/m.5861 type:complete len:124 (-) Transcript_4188:122-493(-)|eukprot:CAMPEP_0168548390 /NCGR_PEP_ID=MMETSP0413-20121227/4532_1 /TAXON_ID=136452 /ORGANISM="Filamoeba nolandi, Strain NC-AS-23-1" /LENGTH=123 /DNA_ID=CAMNT_0008578683 /DNA_START=629 /DNA_END=1000 /DNA_ORIENTATION=+